MFPSVTLPLSIQEVYDEEFYRSNYPQLANLTSRELYQYFVTRGISQADKFSSYFDVNYYRQNNLDLNTFDNRQLLDHFLSSGVAEARKFSPYINLDYYREQNSDLATLNNAQLFIHFKTFGLNEGRLFSPVIDLNSYRASNPNLAGLSNEQLFENFQKSNPDFQGTAPVVPVVPVDTSLFDPGFYAQANPDLATAGFTTNQQLVEHFQTIGLNEGRKFSPFFDVQYYINNNPDLKLAFGNDYQKALNHFQTIGLDEQRRFSQFFDAKYYIDNNPDLRAAGFNNRQALTHFQTIGVSEARRPSIIFNPIYYINNNPDLAAQRLTLKEAFNHFQLNGFQEARPASVLFNANDIAPLLSPNIGVSATSIPDWLQKAAEWGDIPANGTITYSFVTTASSFLYEGTESNVAEVPDAVKNNVRQIIKLYDEVLGISLVEVPDRPPNVGRIRIMLSDGPATRDPATSGYGNQPSDSPGNGTAGDIHLDPALAESFAAEPGSSGYEALLFLVGAALGLDDYTARRTAEDAAASDVNPLLPLGKDNNTNTVMTKNFNLLEYDGALAYTPMPYDIRALQYLYGASYKNSGDTIYQYNVENFFGRLVDPTQTFGIKQTLWDSGGIDTLDFSELPTNAPSPILRLLPSNVETPPPPLDNGYYFDMNEGGQLTTQTALNKSTYYLPPAASENPDEVPIPPTYYTSSFGTSIAFGSLIENLIGTSGNDEILGNNLANRIQGNEGNDKITGARGPDTLTGGDGVDIFVYAPRDGGQTVDRADVITDFVKGIDKIGLALGLPFEALSITQGLGVNANDTLIQIASTGEYLAVLTGISASVINSSDFTPA